MYKLIINTYYKLNKAETCVGVFNCLLSRSDFYNLCFIIKFI